MQAIYILRHFKVKDTTTNKLNLKEFKTWIGLYVDIPQMRNTYLYM